MDLLDRRDSALELFWIGRADGDEASSPHDAVPGREISLLLEDVLGLIAFERATWSWLSLAGVGGCRPSVCGGVG
jgi:hypothetical protein